MEDRTKDQITRLGNPAKPQGEAGEEMLLRMNESHAAVTGWALRLWSVGAEDVILDVGCGGGAALKRLSECAPAGRLYGVDYSPVSVALSKKTNAADISSGKMTILEGSVDALPFAESTFDKALTVESFYFWEDPLAGLKEILRVLKPGGKLLLVADIYEKEGLSEHARENVKSYRMRNPSLAEFRAFFESAGFAEVALHTRTGTDWIGVLGTKEE
ncbi:MAG: class I SAM-dependent methyltransferase [Bacteroides sp.]|nr:class I SAM-dependent methyltransferase [Eubacterium sp.]MCM1417601.1 class I SAM-dependent methyltransferase [Roseburia sp.]MCM1461688.1 class I SAM-dependent methyltransferase [Bacteroides sp.]